MPTCERLSTSVKKPTLFLSIVNRVKELLQKFLSPEDTPKHENDYIKQLNERGFQDFPKNCSEIKY